MMKRKYLPERKAEGGFQLFLENVGLGLTCAFLDCKEGEQHLACLDLPPC